MTDELPSPRHPHAYTLDLLRLAVDQLPPGVSELDEKIFRRRLDEFAADLRVPYGEIHAVIAELGRTTWPYRQAYAELYARYGRAAEEANLLGSLDEGIRAKYERFIEEGGKLNHVLGARRLNDLRQPVPFGQFFSPEERFAIAQAAVAAREAARQEIAALIEGARAEEYAILANRYRDEQRQIEARMEELAALAEVGDRHRQEIEASLQAFREGWSVVERPVTLEEVTAALNYWHGMMEAFLG
jgi:hypothetical protein